MSDSMRRQLIALLEYSVPFFILVWVISFSIRSSFKKITQSKSPGGKGVPGRFRVHGVDRTTRKDVVWNCSAQSEANARAKAELEGIYVTAVDRVPS